MRFELTTPTLARLCSTPELRPHPMGKTANRLERRDKAQNRRGRKGQCEPE